MNDLVFSKGYDRQRYLGKYWGEKHGYYGESGGWIYREGRTVLRDSGRWKNKLQKPVCQGWAKLYRLHWQQVERYRKNKGLYPYGDQEDEKVEVSENATLAV